MLERYKAIKNFASVEFWKLEATLEVDGCKVDFVWERGMLYHKRAVEQYHAMCMDKPTARVEEG